MYYNVLTFIERVTVAGNDLESVAAVESFLEFIPHTFTVLAAVTQLNRNSNRRRLSTACIVAAKATTSMPSTYFSIQNAEYKTKFWLQQVPL